MDTGAGRDLAREGKAGPRLFLAEECGQGHCLTSHPRWEAAGARLEKLMGQQKI